MAMNNFDDMPVDPQLTAKESDGTSPFAILGAAAGAALGGYAFFKSNLAKRFGRYTDVLTASAINKFKASGIGARTESFLSQRAGRSRIASFFRSSIFRPDIPEGSIIEPLMHIDDIATGEAADVLKRELFDYYRATGRKGVKHFTLGDIPKALQGKIQLDSFSAEDISKLKNIDLQNIAARLDVTERQVEKLAIHPDVFVNKAGEVTSIKNFTARDIAGSFFSAMKKLKIPVLGFSPLGIVPPSAIKRKAPFQWLSKEGVDIAAAIGKEHPDEAIFGTIKASGKKPFRVRTEYDEAIFRPEYLIAGSDILSSVKETAFHKATWKDQTVQFFDYNRTFAAVIETGMGYGRNITATEIGQGTHLPEQHLIDVIARMGFDPKDIMQIGKKIDLEEDLIKSIISKKSGPTFSPRSEHYGFLLGDKAFGFTDEGAEHLASGLGLTSSYQTGKAEAASLDMFKKFTEESLLEKVPDASSAFEAYKILRKESGRPIGKLGQLYYKGMEKLGFAPWYAEYGGGFDSLLHASVPDKGYIPRFLRGKSFGDLFELGHKPSASMSTIDRFSLKHSSFHATELDSRRAYLYSKYKIGSHFAQNMLGSPTRLIEALTGMGVMPGKTPLGTMSRILGLGVGSYAAYQYAKYSDYMVGEAIGVKPSDVAVRGYQEATLAKTRALEALGINDIMRSIESSFPGLIESPLSRGAAAAGLAGGGALAGSSVGGPVGAAIGLGIGAIAGGTALSGFQETPEELERIYSGEKWVPERKGKGWFLGRTPYEGGKISYYKPHWTVQHLKQPYKKGLYGSESGYWKHGTWIPTPHNLFGVRKIADPYWLEKRHYQTRPYPVTGRPFEDIPIAGPFLASTIGELIKPQRRMHVAEQYEQAKQSSINRRTSASATAGVAVESQLQATTLSSPAAQQASQLAQLSKTHIGLKPVLFELPEDVLPSASARLGEQAVSAGTEDVISKSSAKHVVGRTLHDYSTMIGLKGFYGREVMRALTGSNVLAPGPREAQSSEMSSLARRYYDQEIGGLFGLTELPRRYLIREPHQNRTVNTLPNAMESWLPGSRSVEPGDRDYFFDFHKGDPYASIPMGEERLPGPGYNALTGRGPGPYSEFEKYKILSNVAPYSDAYKKYRNMMFGRLSSGNLTDEQAQSLLEREKQIATMRERLPFAKKKTYEAEEHKLTVRKAISRKTFTAEEYPGIVFKMPGISEKPVDYVSQEQRDVTFSEHVKQGRQVISGYLKSMEGKQISVTLPTDMKQNTIGEMRSSPVVEAEIPELANIASQYGLYDREKVRISKNQPSKIWSGVKESFGEAGAIVGGILGWMGAGKLGGGKIAKIGAAAGSAILGGVIGGGIEQKFIARYDPIKHYEKYNLYGNDWAAWHQPYKNFIRSWMHQTAGKFNTYVPEYRQEQRDIEEYFDKLKYLKYRMLEKKAKKLGQPQLAKQLRKIHSSTISGIDPKYITRYSSELWSAVPKKERPYFARFIDERDDSSREHILEISPDYMKPIYLSLWKQSMPKDAGFSSDILNKQYERYVENRGTNDEQVQAYFSNMKLPSKNWAGWHPSVFVEDFKIKTIMDHGLDHHEFGIWDQDIRRAEANQYSSSIDIHGFQKSQADLLNEIMGYIGSSSNHRVVLLSGSNDSVSSEMSYSMDDEIVRQHYHSQTNQGYLGQ